MSYYDQLDDFSCQADCQTNPLCKYFTMFNDASTGFKKCFHFQECLEPCADCVTGCHKEFDPEMHLIRNSPMASIGWYW